MPMQKTRFAAVVAVLATLAVPPLASAGSRPVAGFLPANAHPHGHSMTEIATAWNQWAFGTAPEANPILAVRCERSTIDPRIWFLPVSLGGDSTSTCDVPQGAMLVLTPGGTECSNVEPEPFFGADDTDLLACVEETFDFLSYIEVTFKGRTTTDLDRYIVTTPAFDLPANNLLSSDPGRSRDKGYFMVIAPLSRGTHTLRAYGEFEIFDFRAGITYTINVH
jgi:hypothetical protein